MATYKRDEVVNNSFSAPMPKLRYVLRGLNSVLGVSKASQNPMTTFNAEIVCTGDGDTVVDYHDEKINVAGRKITYYIPYTEKNMSNVFEFYSKMGVELDEIDPENPPDTAFLKGIIFEAVLSAEPNIPRMAPAPGETEGKPIRDANGKEIINGYRITNNLGDILGLGEIPAKHSEKAPY